MVEGEPIFDLASLAKPLVTAPLALRHLDLDSDRRVDLGFQDRPEPLTVRQLLSHSAGLPPWLPYTGERLPAQLRRGFPLGAHSLLRMATVGTSTYSDLGYRLLGELVEAATGCALTHLAAAGLLSWPYPAEPAMLPDGPDAAAWALAAPAHPLPLRRPNLPHDANARAGMRGHAGFAATPSGLRETLKAWVAEGWPRRMAEDTARAEDGSRWGLGLQRVPGGLGSFGQLLSQILPDRSGVQVLVDTDDSDPGPVPDLAGEAIWDSPFWYHYGFTGPALFVRPDTGLCICLLLHRRGPSGELLDVARLRARRWNLLARHLS